MRTYIADCKKEYCCCELYVSLGIIANGHQVLLEKWEQELVTSFEKPIKTATQKRS